MGNIINFPTPSYAKKEEKVSFGVKKVDTNSWEYNFWRRERYNNIVNGLNRDSLMAVALGVSSRDIGGRRIRDRSEDDFVEIYSSRIKMELSDNRSGSNFLKRILHEASYIVDAIRSSRDKLRRGGITERESLEIGVMKKELRSKLVKYLLLRDGFYDIRIQEEYENREIHKVAV